MDQIARVPSRMLELRRPVPAWAPRGGFGAGQKRRAVGFLPSHAVEWSRQRCCPHCLPTKVVMDCSGREPENRPPATEMSAPAAKFELAEVT